MQVEQVRFDEVFDVQPWRGDFSFRSRGRTEYGVNLHPQAIPRAGSTLAVAFAEPGNWATVVGWRDLASATVTLKQPTWSFWTKALADSYLHAPFFIAGGFLFGGPTGALVGTLASAAILGFQVFRSTKLNRAARLALSAIGP